MAAIPAFFIARNASCNKAEAQNTEKLGVVQQAIGKHTAAIVNQNRQSGFDGPVMG